VSERVSEQEEGREREDSGRVLWLFVIEPELSPCVPL
jgi:hypothetical protein